MKKVDETQKVDETEWMKQAYVDENEWMKPENVDEKSGWKKKWMKRQWMKQAYVDENEWMKVDETVKGGWKMWMKDETKWMKRSGWIRWERPSPVSAVRAGGQLQL